MRALLLIAPLLLGAAQSTGKVSPTGDVSNSRVTSTGSTTARALRDRAADVVNVKDYGAVGDGVADDTAAFTAAIAAAATARKGVEIPAGIFVVSGPLVIPAWMRIRGSGRALEGIPVSTIKASAGFVGAGVIDISRDVTPTTGYGVVLEDFAVNVNGVAGVHGVYASSANNGPAQITLRRLWIQNHGGAGVYFGAVWNALLDGVTTTSNASTLDGFHVVRALNAVTFQNCYAKRIGPGRAGYRVLEGPITMIGSNGIDPQSATTNDWGVFGQTVADDGADTYVHATFIGNNVEDMSRRGIHLKYGSSGDFFGNTFVAPATGTGSVAVKFDYGGAASIWANSNRIASNGATWANSYAVHTETQAPFIKFGDTGFVSVWNEATGAAVNVPIIMTDAGQGTSALRVRGGLVWDLFSSTGGSRITSHRSGTAAWSPSIVNDAVASVTVTVTGAAVGNTVAVGFTPAAPAGVLLAGSVTADDVVTVTAFNRSGGTWTPGAGTIRADVWQH
jgi:hypothetical protein